MRSLKQWRALRLLSIADLAKLAGVSDKTVWTVETGQAKPQPRTMRKIVAALDVRPDEVAEFAAAMGLIPSTESEAEDA